MLRREHIEFFRFKTTATKTREKEREKNKKIKGKAGIPSSSSRYHTYYPFCLSFLGFFFGKFRRKVRAGSTNWWIIDCVRWCVGVCHADNMTWIGNLNLEIPICIFYAHEPNTNPISCQSRLRTNLNECTMYRRNEQKLINWFKNDCERERERSTCYVLPISNMKSETISKKLIGLVYAYALDMAAGDTHTHWIFLDDGNITVGRIVSTHIP